MFFLLFIDCSLIDYLINSLKNTKEQRKNDLKTFYKNGTYNWINISFLWKYFNLKTPEIAQSSNINIFRRYMQLHYAIYIYYKLWISPFRILARATPAPSRNFFEPLRWRAHALHACYHCYHMILLRFLTVPHILPHIAQSRVACCIFPI